MDAVIGDVSHAPAQQQQSIKLRGPCTLCPTCTYAHCTSEMGDGLGIVSCSTERPLPPLPRYIWLKLFCCSHKYPREQVTLQKQNYTLSQKSQICKPSRHAITKNTHVLLSMQLFQVHRVHRAMWYFLSL